MAQIHGTGQIFHVFTTSGSVDFSTDLNNVSLRFDKNNPDVTTFGDNTIQRISGLRDYSIDFAGIFNSGASTGFSWLRDDMAASTLTRFAYAPGGSISGCPVFSGCALLSTFGVTGPVNGPVAVNFTLQAAAGSLTAACIT